MIVGRVEDAAREAGHREVTQTLMKAVRERAASSGIMAGRLRGATRR